MELYRHCLRPLLFCVDAERAHSAALRLARFAGRHRLGRDLLHRAGGGIGGSGAGDVGLDMNVAGIRFPNPIGLAAGFDKSGIAVGALAHLGFGSMEVGSVSAQPSSGNAKPRLFRLPADEAIVVNYGVPNDGARVVAERLSATPLPVPLGVNLVETNNGLQGTDPEAVVAELVEAARPFCGIGDYIALNLNCPNTTAGSSPFDDTQRVQRLLQGLAAVAGMPPVFLKITAHQDARRADDLLLAVADSPVVAGFIFNLPPGKNYSLQTPDSRTDHLPGTLCGRPTRDMMDATLRFWYGRIDRSRHVLVGSGGICTAADAYRKIRLGASLLQIYSALVFQGPDVVSRLRQGLMALLQRDGLSHLSEAVGLDHPEMSP